mmetsp:Transcript_29892/g.64008  ORF Transcript_29892/g.64008 Transcript_29892/m.64008 type:complete len:223 (-) Transcript_29892:159-827(-)|eukprot:CAMPEP_0201117738 /NCGR_PEP_ID=MMETSP0850-20130426/1769_1 /ASSEMBLY_ACC=CAM_ASM_000622 /TAXON_ID=183588 /ORGANISM="Pseudo-nitzschia fraudulenta, Strain WWA7" /LENGTH=222 /DNA_ID=CAMNT_0047382325 /DNA_START=17 /DNA_END=685 /DNA_ORIENTATION=+
MNVTLRHRCGVSWAFSLMILALSFSKSLSFVISQHQLPLGSRVTVNAGRETYEGTTKVDSRRDFLRRTPAAVISGIAAMKILASQSLPAQAAEEVIELPTKEVVTECFDFIRYELNNPKGGVAYMQERINNEDLAGLLDFSKTYDLEFRKRRFGNAKKLLQDKEVKSKATEYANAVTFDLIGINRSCRKGQESIDSANKYLQELRDDVTKFLALEGTIQVKN